MAAAPEGSVPLNSMILGLGPQEPPTTVARMVGLASVLGGRRWNQQSSLTGSPKDSWVAKLVRFANAPELAHSGLAEGSTPRHAILGCEHEKKHGTVGRAGGVGGKAGSGPNGGGKEGGGGGRDGGEFGGAMQ